MNIKKTPLIGILIVALGASFYCYEYFLRIAPSVMKPELTQFFQLSATGFGTLSAFYFYAYTPMQLFVGLFLDRHRVRNILILAIFLCTLGAFLFTCANFEVAAFGRILQGFGSAFAFVGGIKLASMWLPQRWFALFAGLVGSLGFLGAFASQNIMAYFVGRSGWQHTMHIMIIFGVVLLVLLALTLLHPLKHRADYAPPFAKNYRQSWDNLVDVITLPRIWLAGIFACLMFLPTSVFAALWGIPYLEVLHHYSLAQASTATSMIFLGWAIGSGLTGWLSDVLKKRSPLMRVGALLAFLLVIPLLYMSSLPFILVCILFVVFGIVSAVEALTFVIARDLSNHSSVATAVAFVNMLTMLGGMIFQRGLGELLDWHQHHHTIHGVHIYTLSEYEHAIVIIPASLLLAFIVALFIKDTTSHEQSGRK